MPPKFKFTREEIISAALDIVRKNSPDALTARSLAEALGASSKPIFGLFSGMEELWEEVRKSAYRVYESYIAEALQSSNIPPYKASGMAYILFAKEERELFKLLFMCDRSGETVGEDRESVAPMLRLIQKKMEVDEDTAYLIHLEMWIYVHGVATMMATSFLNWDTDFISESLTDIYFGVSRQIKERKNVGDKNS